MLRVRRPGGRIHAGPGAPSDVAIPQRRHAGPGMGTPSALRRGPSPEGAHRDWLAAGRETGRAHSPQPRQLVRFFSILTTTVGAPTSRWRPLAPTAA
jgi:hypothetical protein